ncbi:MAG TPA: phosphomannomutase/phosphoglucomutase [Candidatus Omnitrophota bacterium]|nr:phosphomannomutase/phosphoglucomutase [Candidatus Omnitrophota bacterium]
MINQNIFREYDIRGVADRDLTDSTVESIGKAYGTFLRQHGKKKIVVGRDGRVSSPRIHAALVRAILSAGIDVTDVGIITTPMMYFSIVQLQKDGGVMVTGSHNPPDQNGLKICLGKDTLFGDQIRELGKMAAKGDFVSGAGKTDSVEMIPIYQEFLKKIFKFARPLKVVIDAGNGASSVVAPKLFRDLGCEVTEMFCTLDGTFPNHFPDPSEEKNVQDLIRKVREIKADIGLAFDGDADRLGVVDETGKLLFGDRLLLIMALDLLTRQPGAQIIADVKCSTVLYDEIRKHGGRGIMWKTGHSLIKAKMRETKAPLAGEMSGHFFFAENYLGFDDGIFAACLAVNILAKSGKRFSALLDGVPEYFSTPEMRIECPDEKKFEIVKKAVEYFKKEYDVIDIDGARINFPDGWGLVRASNTQPVLVMRFEAHSEEKLQAIRKLVESKIREFSS